MASRVILMLLLALLCTTAFALEESATIISRNEVAEEAFAELEAENQAAPQLDISPVYANKNGAPVQVGPAPVAAPAKIDRSLQWYTIANANDSLTLSWLTLFLLSSVFVLAGGLLTFGIQLAFCKSAPKMVIDEESRLPVLYTSTNGRMI